MAFTYIGDLSTNLDLIRFTIQDSSANAGILPAGANFSDAELNGLITLYGTWQAAALAALRAAATQWTKYAHSVSLGDYSESLRQAESLNQRVQELSQSLPGTWTDVGGLGVSTVTKITDIL